MKQHLSRLIEEFLSCGGSKNTGNIFRDNSLAHRLSQQAQGKNVKRQFLRHNVVPTAFVNFLKGSDIGRCDINWPRRKITIEDLATLLDGTYKLLAIKKYPELRRSFLPEAPYSTQKL